MPLWFASSAAAAEPTYWEDVRPILRKHCTACHSQRTLKEVDVSGGLALDNYAAVTKTAKKVVERIVTTDEDKRMPLGNKPLTPETVAVIRRWIDSGAKEGTQPRADALVVATAARRTRKLDVTVPTEAQAPKGALGDTPAGKLELSLKVGPLSPVPAVAFSPDGKLLATGTYGRVVVWEVAAARPVKVLTNVLGAVNDLRFSPDGRLLAVAGGQPSAQGDLRLYQVADWKLLAHLGGHLDVVFGLAFSPDGKRLASASFDKTVRVWDVAGQKAVLTLTGHSDFVYAVAFSPDGKWLVSASKDRTVKLVDAQTGQSKFTFSGMNEDVMAVAVSPDGKNVVSSGFETALYWWDPQTGKRVRTQGGHGVAVHEVAFSKDGKLVASAGADRTVRLWNGTTGASVKTLQAGSLAYAVALSPDGTRLAAGGFDGLVRIWDVASGKPLLSLLALPPEGEKFDWLALTPEGYAASSPGLTTLGQWRLAGKSVANEAVWPVLGKPEAVTRLVRGETVAPAFGK